MADTKLISRIFTDERVEAWRDRYFWVNAVTSILALASFLLFHGRLFPQPWEPWVALFQALCLLVMIGETAGVYAHARRLREGWRYATPDSLALLVGVLMGLGLFVTSHWVTGALDEATTISGFALLTQAGLLAFVLLRLLRVLGFVTRLAQSPLHVFLGSFATLILIGTGLLMLPGAHAQEVSFIEALFTATSATCVTGLVVVDTGTAWTRFGQLVIISLVQLGGLGIMTFAAFFGLAFGRGMGLKGAAAVGEVLNLDLIGRVGRVTTWILGITIVTELAGVAALYGHWVDPQDPTKLLPAVDQLYYSVFHSISAFCNAGFALYPDSMVGYVGHWPVVLSISGLVILGGLGFVVIMECVTYRWWALPKFRRLPLLKRRVGSQPLPRLSLQSKIILTMTVILLVGGAVGMLVLEWNYTLKDMPLSDKLAAATFQSMAARTAGFNSVDTAGTSSASQFWTIMLMIVGGSPGSVAGGIKTTTFFVMILAVLATFRARPPEAFKRRIPDELVRKALVMLVLAMAFICTATLALTVTEAEGAGSREQGFESILFEAASAFCTVGLSTGITAELTVPGKLIIIGCMYVGRIGPLTLVLAIGRRAARKYSYPEETIMIG